MKRILADVDTGIDDALALVYLAALHHAGDIELAGVTTSAGNTTAAQAATNSRYLLDLCGQSAIPVAVGKPGPADIALTTTPETHGPQGLGYARVPTAAADPDPDPAAADLWRTVLADGHCDLLVTGPLTNVAAYPDLADAFDTTTIMGGAVDYPGNTTAHAEWNFWVDPGAIAAGLRLTPTLCSLAVTEQVTITPADIDSWELPPAVATTLADALRFYFEFHRSQGLGYLAQVHDVLAAMIAAGRVDAPTRRVQLSPDPENRGGVISGAFDVDLVTAVHPDAVREEFARAVRVL
ncbi:nucleoside hydrolase [Corynebacterium sp. TAE3-ERU12]|uniref:nucleoside hydrolase n=1 Tax=Corynebacterium sp. TAE3-ERU12 TaxID=2849491 RepID=UPI001C460CEF|nr:nucleoside hydrolase [Corynebacterium sp. TAE3-ERU12]MBV7295984.1 nucleoside hydrolase [Corynebacterium sp. TAE3-ERU12]